MKMDMENRLSGAGVIIVYDPEPFFGKIPFGRDAGRHLEQMADEGIVRLLHIQGIHEMLSGYQQEMCRRNRRNVFNNYQPVILINLFCRDFPGDDPAKETTFHFIPPQLLTPFPP
jgi:hypothetical protein